MQTVALHLQKTEAAQIAANASAAGTGIQELEDSVFRFLYSHAGVLKLMAVVDDMTRMLSQVAARLLAAAALVQVQVSCDWCDVSVVSALCCCAIRAVALQMANSMAVSEGALARDVAVVQVGIVSGARLIDHHLVEAALHP